MGYEEEHAAVFDRNINGWVRVPDDIELPGNQQDRDMIAHELLVKFQMTERHPTVESCEAYKKVRGGPPQELRSDRWWGTAQDICPTEMQDRPLGAGQMEERHAFETVE